jgi:DNA-binding NtrC family response regulator
METHRLNIFILNDNLEVAGKLRRYLKKRFGDLLNISLFLNSRTCINMIYGQVDLVVVDDYLYQRGSRGMSGLEVLKKIKDKSPSTEVVILTSDENVGLAVEAMKRGAKDYIINRTGAWQRLQHMIDRTFSQPIKYLIAEFGVPKFMLIFFSTFAAMAFIVIMTIQYFNHPPV